MPIPDDLQLIVKCPITTNPDRREAELAAIHALPQARPFLYPGGDVSKEGSVCICGPSIQEIPHPMENNLIKQAVEVVHAHRMRFIWGRKLFPTRQGNIVRGRSSATSIFRTATWAVAIAQVTQEAPLLGAVDTFLDCEPNGDHPGVNTWKKTGFDDVDRQRIMAAIFAARAQLGHGVGFCHPAGFSWNPIHFGWATRYVANVEGRIAHQTYRLRHPGEAKPTPPTGMTADTRWWSSYIVPGVNPPTEAGGDPGPLDIEEFWNLPWDDIKTAWPDMRGIVVYGGADLPWLLAELGKGE